MFVNVITVSIPRMGNGSSETRNQDYHRHRSPVSIPRMGNGSSLPAVLRYVEKYQSPVWGMVGP